MLGGLRRVAPCLSTAGSAAIAPRVARRQLTCSPLPSIAVRHDWTREEVGEIYRLPFSELLYRAATVHRQSFDPLENASNHKFILNKHKANKELTVCSEEQERAYAAYYAARIAEGYGFVLPGDEKWPTAPESKAAVAAGADVISPLLVRTSLIMGKVASARHLHTSSANNNLLVKSGES